MCSSIIILKCLYYKSINIPIICCCFVQNSILDTYCNSLYIGYLKISQCAENSTIQPITDTFSLFRNWYGNKLELASLSGILELKHGEPIFSNAPERKKSWIYFQLSLILFLNTIKYRLNKFPKENLQIKSYTLDSFYSDIYILLK